MATCRRLYPGIINILKQKVIVNHIGASDLAGEKCANCARQYSNRFSHFGLLSSSNVLNSTDNLNYFTPRRWKQNKKRKSRHDDLSDDEDDDDDEGVDDDIKNIVKHNKNAKIINPFVNSMRVDAIVKTGMAISRNKAETALYESKVRINGQKIPKKSIQVAIDDVIDLIEGPDPKNPNFIVVTRATILDAHLHEAGYRVKILREKSLTIENYTDKWAPISDDSIS